MYQTENFISSGNHPSAHPRTRPRRLRLADARPHVGQSTEPAPSSSTGTTTQAKSLQTSVTTWGVRLPSEDDTEDQGTGTQGCSEAEAEPAPGPHSQPSWSPPLLACGSAGTWGDREKQKNGDDGHGHKGALLPSLGALMSVKDKLFPVPPLNYQQSKSHFDSLFYNIIRMNNQKLRGKECNYNCQIIKKQRK